MEQKNYKQIRSCYFKSYKSFIDFIALTHNEKNMYVILILKKRTFNNLIKTNIVIRNSHNIDGMYNEYCSNIILNDEEANRLIDDIRNDFKDNHYISYSSVNPNTYIQTLQNSKFSLNIKLNNEYEYEKAFDFNTKINCEESRNKILTKKY